MFHGWGYDAIEGTEMSTQDGCEIRMGSSRLLGETKSTECRILNKRTILFSMLTTVSGDAGVA